MRITTVFLGVAMVVTLPALRSLGQNGAASTPKFSHPKEITNSYLPLGSLKQDILEGKEKGKKLRVERTVKPGSKTFNINGQDVEALIVEDREFLEGKLEEVTLDYFAQDDDENVYYLGEDVDNYKDGKVVAHEGAWLYGAQTKTLGVIMPSHPRVGQKFRPEDVPGVTTEDDVILSTSEKIAVPAGKFENCLKVRESMSDGEIEEKIFAPGIGAVREEDVVLKSHS